MLIVLYRLKDTRAWSSMITPSPSLDSARERIQRLVRSDQINGDAYEYRIALVTVIESARPNASTVEFVPVQEEKTEA